ncbi:MAG: hypothetical protein ABDH21_03970 [bacterium]
MNLLVDFDGVLFDSSWEVTVIILTTYLNVFPQSNISKYLSNTKTIKIIDNLGSYKPSEALKIIQKENRRLNSYIRKLRTYCIDVDDFFVVSYLIDTNFFNLSNLTYKKVNTKFYNTFKGELIGQKSEELQKFIKYFYDSRKYIKDSNFEFWISLSTPFKEEIRIFLDFYSKFSNVGILSTKQKYAIIETLSYYGMSIDPKYIFAKESEFIHKGKKIKEIIDLWNIQENELHFVDDLLENLLRIKSYVPNVNLYMSLWGYNNYEHRLIASRNGINLIKSLRLLNNN